MLLFTGTVCGYQAAIKATYVYPTMNRLKLFNRCYHINCLLTYLCSLTAYVTCWNLDVNEQGASPGKTEMPKYDNFDYECAADPYTNLYRAASGQRPSSDTFNITASLLNTVSPEAKYAVNSILIRN